MSNRRHVVTISVSLAVVGVLIWLFAFLGQEPPARPSMPPPQVADSAIQFVNPTVVGMLDGVRQWEVESGHMHQRGDTVYLEHISKGTLYRDAEPYLTFTASAGEWHQKRDTLNLTGDVVVFREGEPLLYTDALHWNGRNEMLTAREGVELHMDGNVIVADELEGDVKKDELMFRGNIRLQSERMTMTVADKLLYRVNDGSMDGFGPGRVQLRLSR